MRAPGGAIWAVQAQQIGDAYRTHSITRLNGSEPMDGVPDRLVASGRTGTWQWEVRAVASILPSLNAWQNDKEVQSDANAQDDWSYPATTWNSAFGRAYQIADYLLGRPPLRAKITILLVPAGSAYKKVITQTGNGFVPLTLAFNYPASALESEALTSARFSALVEAIAESVHEYQHLLVDTREIQAIGSGETDRTINSEIRSQCWYQSATFAVASGTTSSFKWNPKLPDALIDHSTKQSSADQTMSHSEMEESNRLKTRRFSDADLWAGHLFARNVSSYLAETGFPDPNVMNNNSAGMNRVLSLCRAITQHPRDLTSERYPASQVQYAPFFPANLASRNTGNK
jgi:hypothetical protein